MNIPKVSVIMPVYNTEKYLKAAIDSVLYQTLQEWELILVNDGSTDNSLSILQYYANVDKRITFLDQSNQGVSVARNNGISVAKGTFIYFLDSDDEIKPNTLEIAYDNCFQFNLDFLFFDADVQFDKQPDERVINLNYVRKVTQPFEVKDGAEMLQSLIDVNEYFVSPCLLFIRREFLNDSNILFLEGIVHEDELFTTNLFLKSTKVMYLPYSLFIRRFRDNSTMTLPIKMRNIQSYFIVADTIKEFGKDNHIYKNVIDLYLKNLLNAVLWKAHVMPLKDRITIFQHAIRDWYCYIDMRSFFVLLLRKYITRK